jgi:capsule polysaccharide modification protein KpsS
MMAHEAGKGDKQRPTDTKVFETNFAGIYGDKKPVRGSFVWCDKQQKLISKEEYYANRAEVNAPMVMNDIQPYKSMQTGEMIMSRSQHKAHLKQHGLIEIGNEKLPERRPESQYNSEEVKRAIARQLYK